MILLVLYVLLVLLLVDFNEEEAKLILDFWQQEIEGIIILKVFYYLVSLHILK